MRTQTRNPRHSRTDKQRRAFPTVVSVSRSLGVIQMMDPFLQSALGEWCSKQWAHFKVIYNSNYI